MRPAYWTWTSSCTRNTAPTPLRLPPASSRFHGERPSLGGGDRHRHAQGAAARRSRRSGAEDGRGGRLSGKRRGLREEHTRQPRPHHGLLATGSTKRRTQGQGTWRRVLKASAWRRGEPHWFQILQNIQEAMKPVSVQGHLRKRRLLRRVDLLLAWHSGRHLRSHLHPGADPRLDVERGGAVLQQHADTPADGVHRPYGR